MNNCRESERTWIWPRRTSTSLKAIKVLSRVLAASLALASSVNGQDFLTNGLVAYYPFNGNAVDASGNGAVGSVLGAVLTTNRFGVTNSAYYFDGITNHINLPLNNSIFAGDFTTSLWFNSYDWINGTATLLDTPRCMLEAQIDETTATCIASSYALVTWPFWYIASSVRVGTNTNYQLIITKQDVDVTMFLNGDMVGTSQQVFPISGRGLDLVVGARVEATLDVRMAFHGVIDDIRVYNRALSSDEVAKLYEYESGPRIQLAPSQNLVTPAFSNLSLGAPYQLELSGDLLSWANAGVPFVATNTSMVFPESWSTVETNQFFRLKVLR